MPQKKKKKKQPQHSNTYKANKKPESGKSFIIFIIIAVVAVAGLIYLLTKTAPVDDRPGSGANTVYDISTEGQPTLGNADAKVSVVEFADYKCPACRNWSMQVFPELKQNYIDTDKVSFHFVNFPFMSQNFKLPEDDSRYAALVGESIFQQNREAFWDYYKLVFENQGSESEVWATKEKIMGLAAEIEGIDLAKLEEDADKGTYNAEIEKDLQLVREAEVTVTPTILVNGKRIETPTYENIAKAIEEELEK